MKTIKYENISLITLFIALIFIILFYPLFDMVSSTNLILNLFLSFLLIAAVFSTTHEHKAFLTTLILAMGSFIASWIELFHDNQFIFTTNQLFNIALLAFVIVVHLNKIMTTRTVTKNLLFGSICIYLLIGLMMGQVYLLINHFDPNAFHWSQSQQATFSTDHTHQFFQFTYFSFVTLTTLGYGDIHPVARVVESLSTLEAIAGQFYLTILVARLIGLHVSSKKII